MDIVERLIAYRDRPGRSRAGRDLLAEACNEIGFLRREIETPYVALKYRNDPPAIVRELRDQPERSAVAALPRLSSVPGAPTLNAKNGGVSPAARCLVGPLKPLA